MPPSPVSWPGDLPVAHLDSVERELRPLVDDREGLSLSAPGSSPVCAGICTNSTRMDTTDKWPRRSPSVSL